MSRATLVCLFVLLLAACGKDTTGDDVNSEDNNASSNNANNANNTNSSNNGSNGMSNNSTNNPTNNATNNATNGANNMLGPLSAKTWTQYVIQTYCEATFDCPGSEFYVFDGLRYYLNTFGSKEACIAASGDLTGLFGGADLVESVDRGRLTFDESVADGCLDAYLASFCDEEFDADACDGLFTGQVGDADNCAFTDECSNPASSCQPIMGTCFGACGPELCGGVQCGAAEYCNADDVCTALAQVGEACEIGECVSGATCNWDATAAMGTCVMDGTVAAGGYCWLSSVCVADHFCDFGDDTCKPFAQSGETCGSGDCVEPLICNVVPATSEGTCVTEGSVGQGASCVDSRVCMDGFYCDITSDTCLAADKPLGADCTFSTECQSGLCNYLLAGGTCAEPNSVPRGGACGLDEACMADLFCDIFGSETCVGLGADGETCSDGSLTFLPIACEPGLACLGIDEMTGEGTCGALLGMNGICQDFTQCAAPLTCINSICVPPQSDGSSCASALECESYSCNEDSLTCTTSSVCMVP